MPDSVRLFLAGDVMTGRGVDQILPGAGDPTLHERSVKSAAGYVRLAENAHDSLPETPDFAYPWGFTREELDRRNPDARIVNLETAVTRSDDYWTEKGIHYRMHPDNVPCLTEAGIDVCGLANNHVLDWGTSGLRETLASLRDAGLRTAGAGSDHVDARRPAAVSLGDEGRLLVFAAAVPSSGVPADWAAARDRPGVNLLEDLSEPTTERLSQIIGAVREPSDRVVLSVHWGSNWGWEIPERQRRFAHGLIDRGTVDLVHGHSAHHVKGIEVHRGRLILYGCGDFLNDYEGIPGRAQYRDDLGLMYFPTLGESGALRDLRLVPTRIRRLRLGRPPSRDVEWMVDVLSRESDPFGVDVERSGKHELRLRW